MTNIDAQIAEKVMGWHPRPAMTVLGEETFDWFDRGGIDGIRVGQGANAPAFSTDIAAAWQVVERMRELKCNIRLELIAGDYCVEFVRYKRLYERFGQGRAPTAPAAICAAALEALSDE